MLSEAITEPWFLKSLEVYAYFYMLLFFFFFKALFHLISSSNVDVKNSMSFSGPLEDMFGYTVQQYENEEGKW